MLCEFRHVNFCNGILKEKEMAMYKIIYRDGEFVLNVYSVDQNHLGNISDGVQTIDVTLSGKDESDLFSNCRCWASSNIFGEFTIEKIDEGGS